MGNKFGTQVTLANSTNNETVNDVIGNRSDRSFSNWPSDPPNPSVIGHLTANYYHVHDASRIYPRTSDTAPLEALTLTGSVTALTFGNWVEITGFDSKTVMADVHHVIIGSASANDEYTIQLATGASGAQVFWGECGFIRSTATQPAAQVPIQGKPIPAGNKLWARVATLGGGADTVKIRLFTHQYPSVTGN